MLAQEACVKQVTSKDQSAASDPEYALHQTMESKAACQYEHAKGGELKWGSVLVAYRTFHDRATNEQ